MTRSVMDALVDKACGVEPGGALDPATQAFLVEERRRQKDLAEAKLEELEHLFARERSPDSLLTTGCVCARPGGQEGRTMDRRRACMAKSGNRTPCRCACHAPGVRYFGEAGVALTPGWEVGIDEGVLTHVLALRLAGVDTFDSCQGGPGHAADLPYVRFRGDVFAGRHALAALEAADLPALELRRVWPVRRTPAFWEVVFRAAPRLNDSR